MLGESTGKVGTVLFLAFLVAFVPFAVLSDQAEADGSDTDITVYRYTVNFHNRSTDFMYLVWDFGDGTVLDGRWEYYADLRDNGTELDESTSEGLASYGSLLAAHGGDLAQPKHTYSAVGTYTYTVYAVNPIGYVRDGNAYDGVLHTDRTGFDGGLSAGMTAASYDPSDLTVSGTWASDSKVIGVMGYPTVTFHSNGGSAVEMMTVENTDVYTAAKEPGAPVREGYSFTGWYTDPGCTVLYDWSSLVTAPIDLYAGWTAGSTEHTVTFLGWDGKVLYEVVYAAGDTVAVPEGPARGPSVSETYTFAGWYGEGSVLTEGTAASADATYTATYTSSVREYRVTWQTEDTVLEEDTVAYGTLPVYGEETPVKAATAQYTYTFSSWSPEVVPVAGDTVYTALFDASLNTYTVTFVADGSVLGTVQRSYGDAVSEDTVREMAGKGYKGTFTDQSMGTAYDFGTPVTADATLYVEIDEGDDGISILAIVLIVAGAVLLFAAVRMFPQYIFVGPILIAIGVLGLCGVVDLP